MRYHPHTDADIRSMLDALGVTDLDALFDSVPAPLLLERPLALPEALPEPDLVQAIEGLAGTNRRVDGDLLSFLGAGAYRHHVPAVVNTLATRGEFLTAYTPYQAEVAQGTLQAIFEFQTLVAEILGTDVANASMYDGASATAEAALMGLRVRRKADGVVAVSEAVHPQYREVLATYLGAERVRVLPHSEGRTAVDAVAEAAQSCPVVVVQQPGFFGVLEDIPALAEAAHAHKALLVVATAEPNAFGVVEAPGHQGADIVCGEGQPLGLTLSFGGPGVGLLGCSKKFLRSMPGRLVGESVDGRGQRAYVLTLATREQHIRRERATSNICTNQGLCALMVTIYLSLLGKTGFEELARRNLSAAAFLRSELASTPGVSLPFGGPVFNELTVRLNGRDATALRDQRLAEGLLVGHPLGGVVEGMEDALLVHVSELYTVGDVKRLCEALAG